MTDPVDKFWRELRKGQDEKGGFSRFLPLSWHYWLTDQELASTTHHHSGGVNSLYNGNEPPEFADFKMMILKKIAEDGSISLGKVMTGFQDRFPWPLWDSCCMAVHVLDQLLADGIIKTEKRFVMTEKKKK